MVKPHASGPRYVRERRNHAEILERAEKQERRRSPKVHRDLDVEYESLELTPPDDERVPESAWEYQRDAWRQPIPTRWARIGCLICAAILLAAILLVAQAAIAEPRAAAVIPSPGSSGSGETDQRQPSAPHGGSAGGTTNPLTAPPVPDPSGGVGSALLGGYATWYDVGPGLYAAAGPQLRRALGRSWRHTVIDVGGPGRLSVRVEIVDSCACGHRHGLPTILDLSPDAFAELAPLDAGIVAVSVEIPTTLLPRTDTE